MEWQLIRRPSEFYTSYVFISSDEKYFCDILKTAKGYVPSILKVLGNCSNEIKCKDTYSNLEDAKNWCENTLNNAMK